MFDQDVFTSSNEQTKTICANMYRFRLFSANLRKVNYGFSIFNVIFFLAQLKVFTIGLSIERFCTAGSYHNHLLIIDFIKNAVSHSLIIIQWNIMYMFNIYIFLILGSNLFACFRLINVSFMQQK